MSNTVSFRFVGDEARTVSMLPSGVQKRIEPDAQFDVPAAYWASYACQPHLFEALDEDPNREAMKVILDRVGTDREAAAVALTAEQLTVNPRPKLVAELEKRATPDATAEDVATAAPDVPADAVPAQNHDVPTTTAKTRRTAGQKED